MTLDELEFRRLQHRLDDPANRAVLVIIENDDGILETAYRGPEGDRGIFAMAYSLASQMATELLQGFTPEQKRGAKLVYPTQEQARELGMLPFSKRGV